MTDPKLPDEFSNEDESPKNALTVNGAPIDKDTGTSNINWRSGGIFIKIEFSLQR
jgi:hypothetical protein